MPPRTLPRAPREAAGHKGARRPPSVRAHLWAVMAVALLLAAGSLGYGYVWSSARAEQHATEQMTDAARTAARQITDALVADLTQVEDVAAALTPADGTLVPEECTLVASGSEPFPHPRLSIVDAGGRVVCSSVPTAVGSVAGERAPAPWLAQGLASATPSVIWPATDHLTGRPTVVLADSFTGPDGRPAGLVARFLDAPGAAPSLVAAQAVVRGTSLAVVDVTTGRLVSGSEPGLGVPPATSGGTPLEGRWAGPDGTLRVHASADVAGLPWRVYAGTDHATVVATARGTLARQALTGGVALLALALALWLLDRRVAGPLRSLTRSAVRTRDGADGVRVPEAGAVELVQLARAYNSMLDVRTGQEARLAYQASHDRLTGLPDGDWARSRLDALLARRPSLPDGAAPLGVLHVGLNRFGTIAAGIGPDAADRVLVEVAGRLRSAMRPGDVLTRSGGEGFLVLCEEITAEEAVELAETLHLAVEEPLGWPAPGMVVQVSTGIDLLGEEQTAESLLRGAATALAHAQSRGRVWVVFDVSMRVRATHQLATEHRLREALARDELVVHYQPIVDLGTGRVTGAEALVRWHDPERGMVPPLQFIPVAEESGQITAIGELVLSRACRQAARWQRPGRPFVMSVNVAAAQLLDDGFAASVDAVLRDSGLPPAALCLEVTESAVVRRAGSGVENLHRLRRMGVHLAVDDFGTGYSSLSYLQHLPITALKIDRSFVTRIEHDTRDRHLVDAVVGMAVALGLTVVAEGVETDGQRQLLVDLGCGSAQGYLFGRPCPPEAFGGLLGRPVGPSVAGQPVAGQSVAGQSVVG